MPDGNSRFIRTVHRAARLAHYLASGFLAVLVVFVTTGVISRYFFNKPIIGDFELVQLMLGLVITLALAQTGVEKGHVKVELLVSRLPRRLQAFLSVIITIICMVFLGLMIWQNILYIWEAMKDKDITQSLFIPYYPFIAVLALAMILFWFVLLTELIEDFGKVVKK